MEVKQKIRRQSQLFSSMPHLSDENASNTVHQSTRSGAHFLQIVNTEAAAPSFSTPDPLIQNRRRRLSAPLQNLHNVLKNGDDNLNTELASKPSRQSLCHVPLPIIKTENYDSLPSTGTELSKENSVTSSTTESLTRDIAPRAPKRSRNSLNPEPCLHQALLEKSPFICIPPAQVEIMSKALSRVQSLVHSYTSNETNSARKDIEALTGYVLSSPTIDPVLPYQAPNKAAIYQRLGPQLKQMDEYKSKQSSLVEKIVDARGEKGRGGMKYFCVSNGQRISSAEYEKRYRVMLEEVHQEQSHAWKKYFQDLGQCSKKISCPDETEEESAVNDARGSPFPVSNSTTAFPCREKISLDPEVAKAEAVLWKTIDQALATYSETVLALAKRKKSSAA